VGVYAGSIEPEALAAWCARHLPGVERPRAWRKLANLPVLGSGKHDLGAIRGLVGGD
jgi:o-succinylbenzoate---CoA ligase